jgi:uncharacterized membrane protein YvlD (DUF360 family)
MSSFLMKLIMCPLIVIISAWLFPGVDYSNLTQPIIVGVILAAVGTVMEYMLLKKGTLWISNAADFAASFLIVYYVSNVFEGAYVSFFGALMTAILLGISEHFTHLWLIRNGKVKKEA